MATKSEHDNADLEIELLYTGGRFRESLTTTDFNKF